MRFNLAGPIPVTPSPQISVSSWLKLPGELQSKALHHCVSLASVCSVCCDQDGISVEHKFQVNFIAGMRLPGIGPLPLFFVNKKLHQALIGLIYSLIPSICMSTYFIQPFCVHHMHGVAAVTSRPLSKLHR